MPVYVAREEIKDWINDPQVTDDIIHRKQPELVATNADVKTKQEEKPKQLSMFDLL